MIKAYSVKQVISDMLTIANYIQCYHIEYCNTYAEHTITESLYNAIRDGADSIAEYSKATGLYYSPCNKYVSDKISYIETPENLIGNIDLIKVMIADIRENNPQDSALQSIIDDIYGNIVSISYKLMVEYGLFGNQGIINAKKLYPTNILSKYRGLPKIKPPRLDLKNKPKHNIAPKMPKPKVEKPKNPLSE